MAESLTQKEWLAVTAQRAQKFVESVRTDMPEVILIQEARMLSEHLVATFDPITGSQFREKWEEIYKGG